MQITTELRYFIMQVVMKYRYTKLFFFKIKRGFSRFDLFVEPQARKIIFKNRYHMHKLFRRKEKW